MSNTTSGTRLRERVDAVRDAFQLDGRQRRVDRGRDRSAASIRRVAGKLQTGGEAAREGSLWFGIG